MRDFNAGYEPEGYRKLNKKYAVYWLALHEGSSPISRQVVGIGTTRYPDIVLEPAEALTLLAWLSDHKDELIAKEM